MAPKANEEYAGKKSNFVIAGTPCFVFRCYKCIFNILVEDLNTKVSKLIISWHSWLDFLFCFTVFLLFPGRVCNPLTKSNSALLSQITTKFFYTTVSKYLKFPYLYPSACFYVKAL